MVYTSSLYGKPTLWKVAIDGGDPVQLTNKSSELPAVSPDGKWIACLYWNEQSNVPKRIAIIPFAGGEPIKQFDSPQSEILLQPIRWTPDGRAITYADKHSGVSNIWAQPIDGGPAKRLTDFKDSEVFWYDWSHDGRQLACARGAWISNIVLISDSK
jgi:TolB protein